MQLLQQPATSVIIPVQPVNVQYVIAPQQQPQPTNSTKFPKKSAVGVGVTLIVIGFSSIVFNLAEIGVLEAEGTGYRYFGHFGHGLWGGVMCIIPGCIGIAAGIHKTRNLICAFNVMCIIAAISSAAQFALGVVGAIFKGSRCHLWNRCDGVITSLEAVVAALAFLGAIFAITGSVLCCRTYCCCSCCCETESQPSMRPYHGTTMAVIPGIQQLATVQYPERNTATDQPQSFE